MELLFSLIAGLIIAVALQLVLTNLGIALGLTALHWLLQPSKESKSEPSSPGSTLPITHLVGFGVALSLSTVLFATGLLTTEFSQIADPRRGLIFGIILWATYWLLFIWLSSTTLSSIADSLLGTVLSGGRRLVAALGQAVRSPESAADAETKLQELTEEVAELVKEQQQLPQRLAEQRQTLLAEIGELTQASIPSPVAPTVTKSTGLSGSAPFAPKSLLSRLDLPSGKQLLQRAIDQIDISDIDVQTLWQRLRSDDWGSSQTNGINVIELDAAEYLRQTPAWMLRPDVIKKAFYERRYDPTAAPEHIRTQLAGLDRSQFVAWLQERGDLAADQLETVADQLSQVRTSVLAAVSGPEIDTATLGQVQEKLVAYCRYTNLELLTPDGLVEKVQALLASYSLPASAMDRLDPGTLKTVLERRRGLEPAQQQALLAVLCSPSPGSTKEGSSSPSSLAAPRRWAARSGHAAQSLSDQLTTQVSDYLRYQDKSAFSPTQMARDLSQLVQSTLARFPDALPEPPRLESLFDKTSWQQTLEQRRDLTAAEIQRILAGAESVWRRSSDQVADWAQTLWSELKETIESGNHALLDTARQQITAGIADAQQSLETQMATVKTDIRTQADAARGQVAIAAWWLFISLLLSGVSAAASGWLAVIY